MLKKFSLLAFALAFAGCASSPDKRIELPSYEFAYQGASRSIADDCEPKPCAYVDNVSNGHMTIVGKGFDKDGAQKRFQVGIYFNGTFKTTVMTQENGSFSYTTEELPAGTNVKIQVNNWNGNGQHLVRSFTVPKRDTGDGRQPPSPQPTEYRMPYAQLRAYADQQARTVANRVVATYGALEKWKYNFTMGYWLGVSEFDRSGLAQQTFDRGVADGMASGGSAGYAAGAVQGKSSGSQNGDAEARERFRAVVNTSKVPDTAIGSVSIPGFGGVSAPANACNTFSGYSSTLEGQLAQEMRNVRFGTDEWGYLVYDPSVYSLTFKEIYGWGAGQYEFTDSYFREDYAWNEWFNNDLGGKYDKTNYRKLGDDQRADFRREFKSVYDNVIDEKFYRKKTERNLEAYLRGQYYGAELSKKKKYDAGCDAGYASAYVPQSVRGFNSAYENGYRSGFGSTVNHYNSNPVVSIDGISLVDGNGNGVYELGETIGIRVGSYVNLGRVAARGLRVSMDGDGIDPIPSNETVSLEPSTSKTINQRVMNLARIREDVIADRNHDVDASIGSTKQTLSYKVSWAGTIEALVNLDPSQAGTLKNFVVKNIQAEMIAAVSAKEKKFYKDGNPSKFADLVALHGRTAEGHRAVLAQIGTELLAWAKAQENGSLKGNKWKLGSLKSDFAAKAKSIGGVEKK